MSGYGIEQIASHTKTSPSAVRRAIGQGLAKRRLDAPEDYARLQIARLTRALRCADVSLEQGDLKAIAPFVKVVRELNLDHGVNVGPARTSLGSFRKIAPTAPPLAYLPGFTVTKLFEDEKSRAREQLSL
ncbi:MAG TPA: hypothetical protein VIJ63_00300 [Roseiarcus sp.]